MISRLNEVLQLWNEDGFFGAYEYDPEIAPLITEQEFDDYIKPIHLDHAVIVTDNYTNVMTIGDIIKLLLKPTFTQIVLNLAQRSYFVQTGIMNKISQCATCQQVILVLCGDIETNPGPISMTRDLYHQFWSIFNLGTKRQEKQAFKRQATAQLGIEINHHVPIIEEFFASKEINELIEGTSILGGVMGTDFMERIKNRCVSLCTVVYNLCRWSQGFIKTTDLIVNLTSALIICAPLSLMQDVFCKIFSTVAQDATATIQIILKALLVCIFLLTAGSLPGKHTVDEFLNRVHSIPRAMSGLDQFWSKIDPIVKKATDFVDEHLYDNDVSASQQEYILCVQQWADKVSEYSTLFKRRQLNKDIHTLEAAGKLHVEGIRLLARCNRLGYDRKNAELIRSLLATTYKISESALKSGADKCKVRREPIMVWITGPSGIGKSTFTYPFILDMMKYENVDMENWQQNIYARAPETEFWDGYQDQEYIVYDDAFQLKDSQANPSPELFEIIRLGNMFPYMLHMASIEEKSNSFACPKMVFMSSNLDRIIAESIHCKEAVARRINYAYRASIKEQYRMYYESNHQQLFRLDTSKVQKRPIDLEVYEFIRFDPHTGRDISHPISYEELTEEIGTELRRRAETFSSYDEFLKKYATLPKPCSQEVASVAQKTELPQFQIGRPEADNPWYFDNHGVIRQGNDLFVAPGYKKATGYLDSWYVQVRGLLELPVLMAGLGFSILKNRGWNFPTFIDTYFTRKFVGIQAAPEGFMYYQDKDYNYVEPPRQGCVISQCDVDWVESARRRYKAWLYGTFKPAYYRARFTLPGICAKVIGLLAATFVFRRIYIRHFPAKKSLTQLIDEMAAEIKKAEKCFENGCEHCRVCNRADESMISEYYYWGIPCACYVKVCRQQSEKNRRVFMAYLNTKTTEKVSNDPVAQSKMFDFATSCDCVECPLCTEDKCVCRIIARERGCDIGDNDLLDRTGLYCNLPRISDIHAQNNDHLGKVQQRARHVRVQNNDHLGKVQQKQQRVKVQNNDHLGKVQQAKRQIRVQAKEMERPIISDEVPVSLRPEWQGSVASVQSRNVSSIDTQSEAVLDNRIWPQLMRIYIAHKGDDSVVRHLGHILSVRGSVFLMNYHFVLAMERYAESDVIIRAMTSVIYKRISVTDFLKNVSRIENKDACLVALEDKGISFANVLKHFQPKAVSYSHDIQTITIARYSVTSYGMIPHPIVAQDASLSVEPLSIEISTSKGIVTFVNPTSWEYTAPTKDGDCGAPLILCNSRIPTKIVGIHNAANLGTGEAYGVPLYREEIEKALMSFPSHFQFGWEEPQPFENLKALEFNDGDNFVVVRCEKGAVPAPSQTKVVRSPIFGKVIESSTKPGFLKPFINREGVLVDPATNQRKKWGYHQPKVDKMIAERCTQAVIQLNVKKTARDCELYHTPLTTEQAIIGVSGVEGLNSINKTSSAGWPYSFENKHGKGKKGYFGDFEFDLTTPAAQSVIRDVDKLESDYINNIRAFIVWVDTLKDARIPVEKADVGKTRVFAAGPMHYTILYRKYFLPFFAHVMNNRIDNMTAPGINPVSPEWHKLALRLKSKGKNVIAGDYSNYDGKACTEGYKSAYEAAIYWYKMHWDEIVASGRNVVQGKELTCEEFGDFLRRIAYDCTTHVHLCEKIIDDEKYRIFYQVQNGMPSGNPGTAITNSDCGVWMLIYCWLEMTQGTAYNTIEAFFDHVYACTYGDDVVVNISDEVIEWYNQDSLTAAMLRNFDIVFTDERKTEGQVLKARLLSEVTFLKRSFLWNEYLQLYVAPMPEDLLLDITNWVRKGSEDPRIITIHNLKAVMCELAFISKECFDKHYDEFLQLIVMLCKRTRTLAYLDTYYGYLDKYRGAQLSPIDQ